VVGVAGVFSVSPCDNVTFHEKLYLNSLKCRSHSQNGGALVSTKKPPRGEYALASGHRLRGVPVLAHQHAAEPTPVPPPWLARWGWRRTGRDTRRHNQAGWRRFRCSWPPSPVSVPLLRSCAQDVGGRRSARPPHGGGSPGMTLCAPGWVTFPLLRGTRCARPPVG
jgi:hypothetical protein